MKEIKDFEIINHGIEESQYFQGVGLAHNNYDSIVTGFGNNLTEAINNCLDQMAQFDLDVWGMEKRIMEQEGWKKIPEVPDVQQIYGDINGFYYYVSIRWR